MRVFRTRDFAKWCKKQRILTKVLLQAAEEIEADHYEADLGACLIKKRIKLSGRSRRSACRSIVYFKKEKRIIFIYAFLKNERDNITKVETLGFKALAKIFSSMTDIQITEAINNGNLEEINK